MSQNESVWSRRDLLKSAAAVGAGMVLANKAVGADAPAAPASASAPASMPADDPAAKPFPLKVAIVGTGKQGRVLLNCMMKIPGLQFKAVCDIWDYSRTYGLALLKKIALQEAKGYTDYQEMLDKEKDLDAVIVAVPDWMHSPITCAALKAGRNVYCEKEMANSLEAAKAMVDTAAATKKLLQIGHQRRSNPRYFHALKMIENDKILGNITAIYGQWNRPVQELELPPKDKYISDELLKKYGYDTMERFCNWRWFKKFGGGPIADLGSHQIDIYSWFLRANPTALVGSGGIDYYKGREWYDQTMAIYEYPGKAGTVRAFYQVLNTTSNGGYYETFMGDEGTMQLSEDPTIGYIIKESTAKKKPWEDETEFVKKGGKEAIEMKVGYSVKNPAVKMAMESQMKKPVHQLHLENFFLAIRDGAKLNCPAEVGYETAVTVLRVNDAIAAQKRLEFKPEDFKA